MWLAAHPEVRPAADAGCFTTARVRARRVADAAAHAARLARDAGRLGLGPVDRAELEHAMAALAATASGDAMLRLQLGRDFAGRPRVFGTLRALDADTLAWSAILFEEPHEGASPESGVKRARRPLLDRAAARARARGADEALLLDAAGRLVEGARTNVFVVTAGGALVTPPLARGAVDGLARARLLACVPEAREEDVVAGTLREAREIVCVNAVRGTRAVVALDGRRVGAGRPGPVCARLERALAGPETRR